MIMALQSWGFGAARGRDHQGGLVPRFGRGATSYSKAHLHARTAIHVHGGDAVRTCRYEAYRGDGDRREGVDRAANPLYQPASAGTPAGRGGSREDASGSDAHPAGLQASSVGHYEAMDIRAATPTAYHVTVSNSRHVQPVTYAITAATDSGGSSSGYETMATRTPGGPPPLEFGGTSTAANRSSVDPHSGYDVGIDPNGGSDAVGDTAYIEVDGRCPLGCILSATGMDTVACLCV